MSKCFSYSTTRNSFYRYSFTKSGLKSCTTDLGDGTIMHCWVPKTHIQSKPTLLLIHGFGANAMWQFGDLRRVFKSKFNLYVPDLLFFGDSYTTRPERIEAFQARCVMALMESQNVKTKMDVFGLSYGGCVAYSLAAQYKDWVGRVVLGCAGVCLETKDLNFNVEEAVEILLPRVPEKARELIRLSFYKPPPKLPSCFLNDFIEVMCTEYRQEKKELIEALFKDRKLANLPKISQPTLIIWGEADQVFPVELAHRLKRHIGENAELVIMKNVGRALHAERPKEFHKHVKSFLQLSQGTAAMATRQNEIPVIRDAQSLEFVVSQLSLHLTCPGLQRNVKYMKVLISTCMSMFYYLLVFVGVNLRSLKIFLKFNFVISFGLQKMRNCCTHLYTYCIVHKDCH